ncbi:MAG: PaaI family thioesterase [Sulfurimonadaceae bacterium]|jgi:acyl-CoA thioesterase|nr:PaaI family thioesterase [Sulfurimonadaceae bacterium]
MAVEKEKKFAEIEDPEIDMHEVDGESRDSVYLQTHEEISRDLCGELIKLERGYVESRLVTSSAMVADSEGMIHGGFVFGAADFAAMACVNERNVVLVGSDCQFLAPVKIGNEINFVARVRHKEGRKRNVHVEGFVLDIKVFEGEFKTVVTERHVLRLKLLEDADRA